MAMFAYRALAADGSLTEGQLDAVSRHEAIAVLDRRGLRPIEVNEAEAAGKGAFAWLSGGGEKKASFTAVENFTRQLSSLLTAGVPLSRALHIVYREASSAVARKKWKAIHDLVIDGSSLADAMARYSETFPRVYVAMVRSGEMGGFLDIALGQIAEFQRRERDLKSRAMSALIYPIVLLALSAAVLTFLMVFFIPRFRGIFADFGAALPKLTQGIMAMSAFMSDYGLFVFAALVGLVYGARAWLRTDHGARTWERLALKIPVVGPQVARFAMTRFTRMLGTLTGASVPLINALRVARASLGNQTLIDAVDKSIQRVQEGTSLAESLADCPTLFPGSVVEMIAVGEESGRLDTELVRLAETAEADLDRQLRTAVALVEPLLLMLMAAVIGIVVVGMLLPIFTLQDYIK